VGKSQDENIFGYARTFVTLQTYEARSKLCRLESRPEFETVNK